MKRILLGSALAACALLVVMAAAYAVEFGNGSFEDGNNPGLTFTTEGVGSSDITGWAVVSGTVDYIGGLWQASDGSRSIDLDGNTPGAISQTFDTLVNRTYSVTFDMSGNPDDNANDVKYVSVSATGAAAEVSSYDTGVNGNTRPDMKYEEKTYTFVATVNSTTLTFTSVDSVACCWGPVMDNVVISLVGPSSVDACKNGGWQTLSDSEGNGFKNQGDCVSYVATQGKNLGAVVP